MSGVYIHAVGIVNAAGVGVEEVFTNIFSKGVSGLVPCDGLISGKSTWVGAVKAPLPEVPSQWSLLDCRNNQLLLCAYKQIEECVEGYIAKYGKKRIGIVLGTSTSGIGDGEKAIQGDGIAQDYNYRRQEIGNVSEFLSEYLGLGGPSYTVSTACSSAGRAVIAGEKLLRAELCDVVIVGGSDSLCGLTLNGFDALESVSQEKCNPFSENRRGINIGEGAALFVLSREPADVELLGTGEASDGHHISAPDPEGKGAEIAIRGALAQAGLEPANVGYINLHGTATQKNDHMEAGVVHRIFGDHALVSSTKPFIGHTLGAAAAQELAFCYMAVHGSYNPKGLLPAHIWDGKKDLKLESIRICNQGDLLERPICMSNSFAFGGNNVSLIVGRARR